MFELLSARIAAAALPVALSLLLGGPMIRKLRDLKAGQRVRDDGPQRHLQKAGTPTMGGVLIVAALAGGALVGVHSSFGLIPRVTFELLGVTIAMGAVGFADDWLKVAKGRSLGLKARQKLLGQFVAAILFVLGLLALKQGHRGPEGTFFAILPHSVWVAFWVLATVGTSNAVNFADGLDGLATGLCAVAAAGFAVLGHVTGNELVTLFGLALAGACLGFLYFNRHPARVFMGDVGALALGGALAGLAALLDSPIALIGLCLVPFVELASVVIQVVSYKTRKKRVFKMSPIHHHFELCGWSEQRVVVTFWAVAMVAAGITVLVPLLR